MDNLKGELLLIKNMLNSKDTDEKIEGIKRVIISMSIGKNVEELFQPVIKCLEMNNLKMKKLIYLYIINNSRNCPNDALMIVNQFCKDAKNPIPIIRALAIRTMGCLRVPKLNEYLIDPLMNGLDDKSNYVKKTAILCVPKVLEVSKELVTSKEIPEKIYQILVTDQNPKIVATALITLRDIKSYLNQNFKLPLKIIIKLLELCNEYQEWDQIYVFEILQQIEIQDDQHMQSDVFMVKIESILKPRLVHFNKALVLSSSKLLLKFMEQFETDNKKKKIIIQKIFESLVSLCSGNSNNSYVALQVILSLLQKYNEFELKIDETDFFSKYNDPLYVKMLKLDVLKLISKKYLKDNLLQEVCSYIKSSDIEFSTASVQCFFEIVKDHARLNNLTIITKLFAKIIKHLEEIKNYVIIGEICQGLNDFILQLFMINSTNFYEMSKILKEIQDLQTILIVFENCYQNFFTEKSQIGFLYLYGIFYHNMTKVNDVMNFYQQQFVSVKQEVQLAILRMFVIFFLNEVDGSDQILMELFTDINEQNHDPLVRDQAFIYWRFLTKDQEKAKQIFEQIPKIDKNLRQKNQNQKTFDLKVDKMGTFLNILYLNNQPYPSFLTMSLYQKQFRQKQNKKNHFSTLEMQLVHSIKQKGRKNKQGMEIFAVIQKHKEQIFLILDLKNTTGFVHEILDIKLKDNLAGFKLNENSVETFKKRNIQLNEICMLEIEMDQNLDDIKLLENTAGSLNLSLVFETSQDDFTFKVPYLLNFCLEQNQNPFDQETYNNKCQNNENIINLHNTQFDENQRKLKNILQENYIYEGQNNVYQIQIKNTTISFLKVFIQEDQAQCTLIIVDEKYKNLMEQLVKKIIYE